MRRAAASFCLIGLLTAALPAGAWWPDGHGILTRAAMRALPAEVPAFFRAGAELAAHCSFDPDVAKSRQAPHVRNAEEPEHYLDWELLQGRPLPATRYEYVKLCAELKQDPKSVGLLPYAVAEWTERLGVAFAEHRKWPDNPHIRTKCLVYAGFLAHYAGDLVMPLHTTIHFDGRARDDGSSPRTGIHARVDSLIEKLPLTPAELAAGARPAAFADLMAGITAEMKRSHALVDRVYELEAKLPPERGDWAPTPEIRAFSRERGRAGAAFLASLYVTAWRLSDRVRLPDWLDRKDGPARPTPSAPRPARRRQGGNTTA